MSEFDDGASLAKEALSTAIVAACVIPAFIPALEYYYKFQCDPGGMYQAGQEWLDIATRLGNARDSADDVVTQLTAEHWSGSDRDSFDGRVQDLHTQLEFDQALAMTVGIALCTIATLLYVRIVFILAAAIVAAAIAAAIVVALALSWTGVGAEAAADLEEAGSEMAEDVIGILRGLDTVFTEVERAFGMAIDGMMSFDVGGQVGSGNTGALLDFGQATVHSLRTEAAGLASYQLRNMIAKTFAPKTDPLNPGGPGVVAPSIPKTVLMELNGLGGVDPVDQLNKWLS